METPFIYDEEAGAKSGDTGSSILMGLLAGTCWLPVQVQVVRGPYEHTGMITWVWLS
jgi:hypothetical protein